MAGYGSKSPQSRERWNPGALYMTFRQLDSLENLFLVIRTAHITLEIKGLCKFGPFQELPENWELFISWFLTRTLLEIPSNVALGWNASV